MTFQVSQPTIVDAGLAATRIVSVILGVVPAVLGLIVPGLIGLGATAC